MRSKITGMTISYVIFLDTKLPEKDYTFRILQSSVNVSMWFMWMISGLKASYRMLQKFSNKVLEESIHAFIFITRHATESSAFSGEYRVDVEISG